jgi:hypothetical protein
MTQPTHTHRQHGGKYAYIGELSGGKVYSGQTLVIYHDLDKNITAHAVEGEWQSEWQPIEPDDCPVCLRAGHDQIKGNKDKPCGYCFGLGKVRVDGEAATDMWELSTVASGIIQRQQKELDELRQIARCPEVQAFIEQQRQQTITDSTGKQYQEWAGGNGHGPGGKRYTGD